MQNARAFFAGKKITLMGLGLLGRGLGDAKFLAEAGAELIITDLKTEVELAPSVAALANLRDSQGQPAKITFHLGGHSLEDFENRDLIIKAPNTPLDSPFIARARERGIPIEMDAALFAKLAGELATIVGITGTRGKSTTTYLIYEMARAAFGTGAGAATAGRKVYLGGNVKDTATLPLIDVVVSGDIIILELDSWQLQGFEENKISPNIAVWTNFMPDHMNYYRGDVDRYFADKTAIARWQKPGDIFIAPREIKEKIEARFADGAEGKLAGTFIDPFATDTHGIPDSWEIALPGVHNRANAACAIAAARALSIPDEIIKKVLKNFHALPHRLEFLGEKNGIAFYDDSNATTPDATTVALQTLAGPIVLIAGGSDKELDFAPLARQLADEKNVKKIILFEGKASEKLKALLPKDFSIPIAMATNMKDAFAAAVAAAQSGDIILLSPAATSFGLFKNEYDRGEQFQNNYNVLQSP